MLRAEEKAQSSFLGASRREIVKAAVTIFSALCAKIVKRKLREVIFRQAEHVRKSNRKLVLFLSQHGLKRCGGRDRAAAPGAARAPGIRARRERGRTEQEGEEQDGSARVHGLGWNYPVRLESGSAE